MVGIVVEKMERTISMKAHPRVQERTPGNVLCCEPTILVGTETVHRKKVDPVSKQEHFRIEFYKRYQKEAEGYDKVFMKKYEDDLNNTLIFVSLGHLTDARVR